MTIADNVPLFSVVAISSEGRAVEVTAVDTLVEARRGARAIVDRRTDVRSVAVMMGGQVVYEVLAWKPTVKAAIHALTVISVREGRC